ncbi:carbohydrate kinase [Methylobacterium sp. GC_Met_2]|uniref:FGGY-family carbohydrate kinase n=1 Tax=Methylobacterium sp. GC_Met_2 TaxID=2937376 RepID=UPI00226B468D|nr:carbohydrate kinase [Methylobacterium sp. GC_Met_2]
MTSAPKTPPPRRIAVIDIGKTNVKLVIVDTATCDEIWVRTVPNTIRRDGPYPHADVAMIEAFLVDALADAAAAVGIDAVSITTHGATGALIGPEGLVLPVLDYEHDGPDALDAEYGPVRPAFAESFSPRLPGGLNLGAQLFWQARLFSQAFARATHFVTYPQYWAWRLTGVAATEPTSLGCHTDLWAPGARRFSSLVERMDWGRLMAPVRSAFDVLGTARPDLADRIGLGPAVPVACGLHDSNASLLPYIQGSTEPRTILSTGTWIIAFAVGGALDRLDAGRDMLANVDAYGRPVPSARFMGGREFDHLTGRVPVEPDPATVASVLARNILALPGFAHGSGPFPDAVGAWSHDPDSLSAAERTAAATLYAALTTATCLDLLGAAGPIFVEGPFARNTLYGAALAQLSRRPVQASPHRTGTSSGAACLFASDGARDTSGQEPTAGAAALGPTFDAYAARWRREAVSH